MDRSVAKVVVELLAAPKCSRGRTVAQSNEFGRIKTVKACVCQKRATTLSLSVLSDDTVCAEHDNTDGAE